jgi:hypothetical protein
MSKLPANVMIPNLPYIRRLANQYGLFLTPTCPGFPES